MRFIIFCCCLYFICVTNQLQAQLKQDDVSTFTLQNGMQFIVLPDHSIPNANMYLFFKVGSRNEYTGITGLSHFFEHMMFNGAKKYGPKQLDKTEEFNGGANNAYTTENVTVYTDWFPASKLELFFDIESDRIANLAFDSSMIESEREVVHSEWRTDLENSPWEPLSQAVVAVAFNQHPYHWPVIGYETDIKNWKRSDLQKYFKTYYAPNNCVAVISGNVTVDEVKNLAEKYMAPIPAQTPPPPVHIVEPKQAGERRVTVQQDVPSPYILMSYHVPATKDSDHYALDVLSAVLSNGNSSRLYSDLVDKKQIATNVFTDLPLSFDPFEFNIYAECSPGANTTDVEHAIYEQLNKIKTDGITAEELQKVKNQKLMDYYANIESINGKSEDLGNYEVFFGDYKKMFEAPEEYNKITLDDVKRVANTYFKKSNRTVGILQSNVED